MLPQEIELSDYRAIYAVDEAWLPALRTICQRHGLDKTALQRQTLGTHVVFRCGPAIIKLFCPIWPNDYAAEAATLAVLSSLPTPEIIDKGSLEGWPYLILTVLPGRPAGDVWDEMDGSQQAAIVYQLGTMMRVLHSQPALDLLASDWNAFLAVRRDQWREHHQAQEPWTSWLGQRLDDFCEEPFEPVLLNCDITADHLLLSEVEGRWDISGLIDFGDAMMGHAYYDFIAPLTGLTLGQPRLSHLLLESYGLKPTAERTQRLTSYCFLHRFGRLADYQACYLVADGPAFQRALWGDL